MQRLQFLSILSQQLVADVMGLEGEYLPISNVSVLHLLLDLSSLGVYPRNLRGTSNWCSNLGLRVGK